MSVINFHLIFVKGIMLAYSRPPPPTIWTSSCPYGHLMLFVEKPIFFSSLSCLCFFVKDQLTVFMWIYFRVLDWRTFYLFEKYWSNMYNILLVEFSDIFLMIRLQLLWPPDEKKWLIGKDPDAGRVWKQKEGSSRGWDGQIVPPTQQTGNFSKFQEIMEDRQV